MSAHDAHAARFADGRPHVRDLPRGSADDSSLDPAELSLDDARCHAGACAEAAALAPTYRYAPLRDNQFLAVNRAIRARTPNNNHRHGAP